MAHFVETHFLALFGLAVGAAVGLVAMLVWTIHGMNAREQILLAFFDFLKQEFNKILLTFLFMVMVGVVLWMAKDATNVNWAREQAALILGGLLGLITGVAIGKSGSQQQQPKEEHSQ